MYNSNAAVANQRRQNGSGSSVTRGITTSSCLATAGLLIICHILSKEFCEAAIYFKEKIYIYKHVISFLKGGNIIT